MKRATILLAGLLAAGCLAGGPDSDATQSPSPTAGFDAADLPPGCNATRPAMSHREGALLAIQAGTPIPCTSYIGTPSFEPNVAVASDGTVFMYPAAGLGLPSPVAVARSRDEGATWQILTPNVAGQPTHPYSQDPYMYVDPGTDRLFAEDLLLVPPTCGMMSISTNKGDTWMHTQSGCATTDHVTIFSGKPVTSTMLGYPNVVYRCAISGGALAGLSAAVACQRSIDGGMTWLAPGAPAFTFAPGAAQQAGGCAGGNGHGSTNAKGRVYLPRGHCGQPWLAISEDEAVTWRTVQVAKNGMACSPSICEHDAGVGEDANGTLYYSWVAGDRLAYLSRSRDAGRTWDEPQHIGLPGLTETALLQMAVGANGRIALVYYGTTTGPAAPFTGDYADTYWNAYLSLSFDADQEVPTFHTVMLNPPDDPLIRGACGPLRCQEVFDYIDIRIGPDGTPWVPLVDGCFDGCPNSDSASKGLVGRAWGAPTLWDDIDPNGHFPGTGSAA